MLSIFGRPQGPRFCDALPRRSFLQIGGLSFAGYQLGMVDVLRAEADPANPRRHRSVIQIFLAGGPPHQDMWDLKMEAPAEIRGEFQPIATSVPGIQICEVFPKLAQRMD